jgi:hypothetical protein
MRDSAGHALAEAEVSLPALNRLTRTNYMGEFRIDRVPAGRHAIVIRHVGFAPYTDSIDVGAGAQVDREFVLAEQPVRLDSQKVVGQRVGSFPFARDFDDRRKVGLGHFFDTEDLRKIEGGRSLMNYLASRLPGMSLYRQDPKDHPTDWYMSSGRGRAQGGRYCPIAIYIDGSALFIPGVTRPQIPPDISQLNPYDFAAVEYYADGATAPSQFNGTGSDCGVLLLWRRYR